MSPIYIYYIILTIKLIGLALFGGYFILSGINHFMHAKNMIGYATFKKVPYPKLAVYTTGVLLILGGFGTFLQVYQPVAYLSSIGFLFLIIFLVPTTFMMHNFWKDTDPEARMSNKVNFLKNLALLGAILLMI
ncbi:MAG: DoxX family protein [Candidatus Paceibacterota bacterium]|jgi:uncharacterized membrane protein YphA (DoxX/SURF4 family)